MGHDLGGAPEPYRNRDLAAYAIIGGCGRIGWALDQSATSRRTNQTMAMKAEACPHLRGCPCNRAAGCVGHGLDGVPRQPALRSPRIRHYRRRGLSAAIRATGLPGRREHALPIRSSAASDWPIRARTASAPFSDTTAIFGHHDPHYYPTPRLHSTEHLS